MSSRFSMTIASASRLGSAAGICCMALLLLSRIATGQEPEVLVELERPRIFEGESVRYTVTLNHCEDSAKPTLPETADLRFRQMSVRVIRQTVFDGFKRTSIGGPSYEYLLTPQRGGELTIPGPTVVVDRKTYRGETLKLQVVPPHQQDLAVLEVITSRQAVYPLQPFSVRLTVLLKGLPEPYEDKDPLHGVGESPVIMFPWADDERLPEGVKPDSPALRWLQGMLQSSRRPIGFGINNLRVGSNDVFAIFTKQQHAVFHPEPRRVKRKDAQGRTVDYWEYIFERTMTATKLGSASFGPVSLKGTFASRAKPSGGVEREDVYAVAKPIVVEVRDVPADGRPPSYIGAVGRFEVDAELAPMTAKVGDPMTLSLRLHGQGTLSDATAPKLDQTSAIAKSFRVYEATEESADGERRFTYSLRPQIAGISEFPPIELAYFDVEQEKYVTLKTAPIKIQVADSDRLANQDIAVASINIPGGSSGIESSGEGIFANITDPRQVYDERVRPDVWFLSLGSMAGIFVVCGLVTRQLQRRRNDPVHQRRRMAAKRALAALAESRQLAKAGSRRETIETLSAAIIRLVADAVGSTESGLTSRDVARELASIGVGDELIARCQRLLDEFDAARYGDGTQRLDEQVHSADQLLSDLIHELRQRKLAV